jgi:hypothetical protein
VSDAIQRGFWWRAAEDIEGDGKRIIRYEDIEHPLEPGGVGLRT